MGRPKFDFHTGDAALAVDQKLWAPEGARIPDNVAAAACYGDLFDTQQAQSSAASAGARISQAGAQVAMMAQQILPQIFPTAARHAPCGIKFTARSC